MIKKTMRGYEVISHKTGRCMGIYPTKKEAEKRLQKGATKKRNIRRIN